MSLELNEEIDIKSETIEELDFISSEIDIKNESFEEQDNEFERNGTSGDHAKLSGNETDIKIDVEPVKIGGEVVTTSLSTNSISDNSHTCQICNKEYRLSHNLRKHLRLQHKVVDLEPFIKCLVKCVLCNETFAQQCDLLVHLLSHAEILHSLFNSEKKDSGPFACKMCGASHQSTSKVLQHIKTVHLGLREYKCNVCNLSCSQKEVLRTHFIFQHSEFEPLSCVVCTGMHSSKFSCKSKLKNHMLSKHKLGKFSVASILKAQGSCKNTFTCKVCDVKFESRSEFHKHISVVHEGLEKINCPVCHKDFTCIVKLINHLHAHGYTKPEQINEFKSNGTSGLGPTLTGNEPDNKIDVDPAEIVGEVATTSLLTNSNSGYSYTCAICSKKYKSQQHLSKHLRYEHDNDVLELPIKSSTKCFVCNKAFSIPGNLSVHLLSHADVLHPLFKIVKKGSCTFVCKICGFSLYSNSKVVSHIKSDHLGLKEYKCKVCSTYFTQKVSLMQHFSKQHSLFAPHKIEENSVASLLPVPNNCETSLSCKVCNVVFKSRGDFHQHVTTLHEGLDAIKCPVCQENFTCIVKLIDHLHAHSDTNQHFSCVMCEERFSTENDRSTHLINFHNKFPDGSSGSSNYECDKCKKVFTCSEQLKEHSLQLHDSNLLSCFKCDKCDLFGSFDNLEKHVAAKHSEDTSFTCSVCKETFSSVQSLKIHLANMHKNTFETSQFDNTELLVSPDTKIGIVRCEICKQNFDNPTSLMNHFIKIHKNNKKQTSLQQNRRERQKVSQREHRTAEYWKNILGSSPVKPQLQQATEKEKVKPDCNCTDKSRAEILITKVKPCYVLLDRGEVTRYLARLDKREEGTVGSSLIEDLPSPFATPPVRVYPSHPCRRVRVSADRLLSAATSNVGLVCNNIGPRAIVEPKQLCDVNSGDGEVSSNNCIKSVNLASQQLGNFEEIYMTSEPIFHAVSDSGDPLSS